MVSKQQPQAPKGDVKSGEWDSSSSEEDVYS